MLDSTVYFALQHPEDWAGYSAALQMLIDAGGDVDAVTYPTGSEPVDEFLSRHGARGGEPV